MYRLLRGFLLVSPALVGLAIAAIPSNAETLIAQTDNSQLLNQVENYSQEGKKNQINQVTNVNQLRDVSPTDWAYEALRSLVDRYGCIVGYPNQTYRGSQALSRYEFAAGLNSCLNQIERLIASSESVLREDLDTINRLTQEFEAELATLGGRVDDLESRTAFLEDHQFSTTTKLQGEAVFSLAQEFNYDNQAVFQNRVRLAFVSSFTGKDSLYTRLDAGNSSTFNGETEPLDQGTLTYNFDNDNNVEIGWLAYYFPIGDKIQVYLPAAYPLWQDFVPTVSPYLDSFTGATGSLSSFGESSPIYKIGLGAGGGIGFNFTPFEQLTVSAGYFGGNAPDPSEGNGLFNGEYSALGQVTFSPFEKLQLAATYVRGYFTPEDNTIFDLGVGTPNAKNPLAGALNTNSFGLEGSFQLSDKIAFNAFGMYTDASQTGDGDEAEIWSYGAGLAFPDLIKEGSLGGVIVGAEPYNGETDDIPLHVEGFYKYQLNDNISVTPGVIWLNAPGGDKDADDAIIGVLRTTFTF
ncbi:cyanobacterial porin [Stanieria cyanosphaera PCC 7437]|uniref:Cyanobacterial porin n=1 Tax=Stanieria cyanosphaera (strain ATCC 29371 / PCC 7437) TaxID=111780 RepID=K9XPU4_STAC7|nr:iron uptake porin [Stanieria cyanosphaera]AFZ34109.1 cyanobacterial porin [Stanieria cyanosphaera PCC 7437]